MAEVLPPSGLAVLLVTRRYWPLTDDAVGRLAELAAGLRRGGIAPTILAARYAASWPTMLHFREVPIVRAVAAPRGEWSAALYVRGLHRWLRDHAETFDLLYADNMREEGSAVVEAAERAGLPSVVRCGGVGAHADGQWAGLTRANLRHFTLANRADAIVAPQPAAARAVIAAGADRQRVHRIDDGIPASTRGETANSEAARRALAAINSDLQVPCGGRVVMLAEPLARDSNLITVADAVVPLCDRFPDLRVWFIGDGPQREALHDHFCRAGIRDVVAMPGCFGHVEELLQAADILVATGGEEVLQQRLPAAIGAALPIVLADTPEIRVFLGPEAPRVARFRTDSSHDLTNHLQSILDDYGAASARAVALRRAMRRAMSREHSIDAHLRLFHSLVRERERPDADSATELPL